MVNVGHPSRGCYACRRKKVKCDETFPECSKCTKAGKSCPGYRPAQETHFRHFEAVREPSRSQSPKKRPRPKILPYLTENQALCATDGRIVQTSLDHEPEDNDIFALSLARQSQSSGSVSENSSPPALPRMPNMPWEQLAVPLFFDLFTTSPIGTNDQSFLHILPRLYGQSSPDSCLYRAVSAAADANAVRKLTDDKAVFRARHKHLTALEAVQKAIQDPVDAFRDSTLCSLFVLTLFEYITGDTSSAHGSHISGYEALLYLRSHDIYSGSLDYSLFLAIASQVLIKHLRDRSIPSPRTVEILQNLAKDDPGTAAIQINLKICQFNGSATNILERRDIESSQTELLDVLYAGEHLDETVKQWPYTDDPAWAYSVHNTPLRDWSGPFHQYDNLIAAYNWNLYRSARVILLLTLVRCCMSLLRLGQPPGLIYSSLSRVEIQMATLLGDIVASFPYSLGRGDSTWAFPTSGVATNAFALLWSTGVVARCPLSTPEQKATALEYLEYIGQALGLQRAMTLKGYWSSNG